MRFQYGLYFVLDAATVMAQKKHTIMKKEVNIRFVPVTLSIDPLIAKYLQCKPAVIDNLSKEIQCLLESMTVKVL